MRILITGASSRLGRAIAAQLGEEHSRCGADVERQASAELPHKRRGVLAFDAIEADCPAALPDCEENALFTVVGQLADDRQNALAPRQRWA